MPKSFRINFMGGTNTVVDKQLYEQQGFVNTIDNASVRSGSVRPFKMPVEVLNYPGSTASQLFEYRGKYYLSSTPRSYAAEYVGQTERIYFSEYGNVPQKIIEGIQVPLGTAAPTVAPGVSKSSQLNLVNIGVTENVGAGNYTKDRRVSYRIAIETEDGIQAPSSKIIAIASAANAAFTISWSAPSLEIKAKNIIIFGTTEDKERRLVTLSPLMTSYQDLGLVSEAGEAVSVYDQELTWQYVYTFIRDVAGVRNESGPSPLSGALSSNAARSVTIGVTSDGLFGSTNLVSMGALGYTPTVTQTSSLGATVAFSSIAVETASGRVLATTTTDHEWLDGELILFEGFSDTSYLNKSITVRHLETPDPRRVYLDMTAAPSDVSMAGRTGRRVVSVTPSTSTYQPTLGGTLVDLGSSRHTFRTGEKVQFVGYDDPAWTGKREIVVPTGSNSTFLVKGVGAPTGTVGTIKKLITKYYISAAPRAAATMYDGDAVNLYLANNADTTQVISGVFRGSPIYYTQSPNGWGFMFSEYSTWSGTVASASHAATFVPHNDYIVYRRLYRVGDSGEFLKVTDLYPHETTFVDGKSTDRLGDPISSYYEDGGITTVYSTPPLGAESMTSHYHMMFCVDDHTLRWSVQGVQDAWPQTYFMTFPYKPVALASYAQALIVLCENALYRVDGNTATSLTRSKTLAEDGCVAPGSVQATGAGLVYLSKRGIMLFDGQQAVCISDGRIHTRYLLGTAGNTDVGFFWMPTQWSKLYQDCATQDGLSKSPYAPDNLVSTEPIRGTIKAIRSFYYQGRYFMYWSNAHHDYAGHAMLCIDMQSEGYPITFLGFKPLDVCVSDNDEAYCLVGYPPEPV